MKTCMIFCEGYNPKHEIEITVDKKLEYKIKMLKQHNEYIADEIFTNYLIYHNAHQFKSNIQNSIFNNYNGRVFVTHKDRDLNEDDLSFFKQHSETVLRKGKRIYTAPRKKKTVKEKIYRKPGVLKIN